MLLIEHRATLLQGRSGLQQSGYKDRPFGTPRGAKETGWIADLTCIIFSSGFFGADLKFEAAVCRELTSWICHAWRWVAETGTSALPAPANRLVVQALISADEAASAQVTWACKEMPRVI